MILFIWKLPLIIYRIKPHYKPLIWGVGTAITLFATFRVSKYVSIARTRKQIGYTFEKIQNQKSQEEKLGDLASVPVDMILSLLVGLSASLFLTDDEKLKKDFSKTPLVKGRSLIAEEFCDDYRKEFQKISPPILKSKEAVESSSMRAIQNFVHNCEQRNSIIAYREKEQMLDRSDAENLPSPVLEEIKKIANQK